MSKACQFILIGFVFELLTQVWYIFNGRPARRPTGVLGFVCLILTALFYWRVFEWIGQ